MRFIILFIFFSFSIYPKERLVVLDFIHPKNVSREMAVSSYNYFVSELNRTEKFDIIEKSQLNVVLKEIEFQQSGCTDTICEIKIGQMLYADKIASGNIIKKEKKYIISINIRNVKDNSLEFAETIDLYDEDKLEFSMNSITQKITQFEQPIPIASTNELPYLKEFQNSNSGEWLLKKVFHNDESQEKEDGLNSKIIGGEDNTMSQEDIERIKRNKKLDDISQMEIGALWRTIVFPGWGHFYWNENVDGGNFIALYGFSLISLYVYAMYQENKVEGIARQQAKDSMVLQYYLVSEMQSKVNDPFSTFLFFGAIGGSHAEVEYEKRRAVTDISFGALMVYLGVFLLATKDIQEIRKGKERQIFSFNTRPETSYSGKSSVSQGRFGNYFEFSYSMRF